MKTTIIANAARIPIFDGCSRATTVTLVGTNILRGLSPYQDGTVIKEQIRGCGNVTNVALYRIMVMDSHARLLFRLPEKLPCGYRPSILNPNAFAVLLCDACAKKFDLADLI
jgi:hypothetical protein